MDTMPADSAILAVDIEKWSRFGGHAQVTVHKMLVATLREAFAEADFDWNRDLQHEDTGDGAFVTVAGEHLPKLVDPVVQELERALRRRAHRGEERLRLRAAVHAGPVDPEEGVGPAKDETARLLDSEPVYALLRRYPRPNVGLIVSDAAYRKAVGARYTELDPTLFTQVIVTNKEYRASAWVHAPGEGTPQLDTQDDDSRPVVHTPAEGAEEHASSRREGLQASPAVSNVFNQENGTQVGNLQGDLNMSMSRLDPEASSGEKARSRRNASGRHRRGDDETFQGDSDG